MSSILFQDDFLSFNPSDPGSNYFYVAVPETPISDDGVSSVSGGVLTVDSSVYTHTSPADGDYHKFLVFTKSAFTAPANGDYLVLEANVSSQQTNLNTIPASLVAAPGSLDGVVDPNLDPRPCCGALNLFDVQANVIFDFIITNKMIYALYERFPYGKAAWGGPGLDYTGFVQLFPLANRPHNTDTSNLKIAFNRKTNSVSWFVDGKRKLQINSIGVMSQSKYTVIQYSAPNVPLSPQPIVRPNTFLVGFGNLGLMGATSPLNPGSKSNSALVDMSLNGLLPDSNPNGFNANGTPQCLPTILSYAQAGNTTNFGQGNVLEISSLKVYTASSVPNSKYINPVPYLATP